jgi:hypothetical protein
VHVLNQANFKSSSTPKKYSYGYTNMVLHAGSYGSAELLRSRHVVLFLAAQSKATKMIAFTWLEVLRDMPNLQTVGIVIKGNERCSNDWLIPYIQNQVAFPIRFILTIYGYSSTFPVSKSIFPALLQWPLGVAGYRGFPKVAVRPALADPVNEKRKHLCNFLGTVFKNSHARKTVLAILQDTKYSHWNCHLKYRLEWTAEESSDSVTDYVNTLKNTDFTLCPAGQNVESFRIYEAMSFGSVPVLQSEVARMPAGDLQDGNYTCRDSVHLLKYYSAPVIWVTDWSELPEIMEVLLLESPEETYSRRFVGLAPVVGTQMGQTARHRMVHKVPGGNVYPVRSLPGSAALRGVLLLCQKKSRMTECMHFHQPRCRAVSSLSASYCWFSC